jgi:hypothetical protein
MKKITSILVLAVVVFATVYFSMPVESAKAKYELCEVPILPDDWKCTIYSSEHWKCDAGGDFCTEPMR